MHIRTILPVVALSLLSATSAFSQSVGSLSIPAAAFDGVRSFQNTSGTSKYFRTLLYAPVFLPHGSTAINMTCGGKAPFGKNIIFTLRRNQPQQANVDMAVLETSLDGAGFEFVTESVSDAQTIDNRIFNYFIVVDVSKPGGNLPGDRAVCPPTSPSDVDPNRTKCSVGFCRVTYTLP